MPDPQYRIVLAFPDQEKDLEVIVGPRRLICTEEELMGERDEGFSFDASYYDYLHKELPEDQRPSVCLEIASDGIHWRRVGRYDAKNHGGHLVAI